MVNKSYIAAMKLRQIWAVHPTIKMTEQPCMIEGTVGEREGDREGECSACVQPSFSLFPGDGRAGGQTTATRHAGSKQLLRFVSENQQNK